MPQRGSVDCVYRHLEMGPARNTEAAAGGVTQSDHVQRRATMHRRDDSSRGLAR
jgi:hypothetical protein